MLIGLLVLLWYFPQNSCVLKYDIEHLIPVWTDSSEPRSTWRLGSEKEWRYKKGVDNDGDKLGLLLTGISEFPWIVDIRVDNVDEDKWSTGNLVSFWYVLTSCRAVDLLEDDESRLNGTGIKVTFSQQYLWEYQERLKIFPDEEDYAYSGTRISEQAIRHPHCTVVQNVWDVAILKLTYGIQPATPKIGYTLNSVTSCRQLKFMVGKFLARYIPIVQDYTDGSIPEDVDLSQMEQQRLVCFVASIGRNYLNSRDHLAVDFKVKYRVYLEDFNECVRMIPRMCKVSFTTRNCGPRRLADPDADGRHWMCFRTRAKVGTVCDHDRGAPLVCGGEVYGIVVMGALGEYCNSVLPVQFVVTKITQFRHYFEKFINVTERQRSHSDSAATSLSFFFGINLSSSFLLIYYGREFIGKKC